MGRGKRHDRTRVLPISDGDRSRHDSPPVSVITLPKPPTYADSRLNDLRAGLQERLEREMEDLQDGDDLADYMGLNHPDGPLRWFLDYIVADECDDHGLALSIVLSDADIDDLDGLAAIFADYQAAQAQPTPGMQVYVDWSAYRGPEGVVQLTEQFYSAYDSLLRTRP